MKRKILIGTIMIFAWVSLFLVLSCAKKQVMTEEKITEKPAVAQEVEKKAAPTEEAMKRKWKRQKKLDSSASKNWRRLKEVKLNQ